MAGQREIRREPVPLPGVHLYAAYLGGPLDDGRMGEDHEVVLVVAVDPGEAKSKAMAKWRGAGRGRLDALERIDRVDGHRVLVSEVADGDEGEDAASRASTDRPRPDHGSAPASRSAILAR